MCRFLSAIWTKEDRLICCPHVTDSHDVLAASAGLRDDALPSRRDWVRVEYVPGEDPMVLPWGYSLDEHARPDWYDEASEERCKSALRAVAEPIVAPTFEGQTLLAECRFIFGVRVFAHGSRLFLYGSSRAVLHDSSRAEMYGSSQAVLHDSSRAEMYGSSQAVLHDSSRAEMYRSSQAEDASKAADARIVDLRNTCS